MKNALLFFFLILTLTSFQANAQSVDSTDVYLITCEPGSESYSVYGHSALRIIVRGTKKDLVYNWGLFDFETPNFAFRFAKGNLDYLLGSGTYNRFLEEYYFEGRSVWSQKINLTAEEKLKLFDLLNENLKPENRAYRYDFFYDNCSTRVRDIIENSLTVPVTYEQKETRESFRDLIDVFQKRLPWLDFGADFLLGLHSDKKATFREQMFLPMYLKDNMANTTVDRSGTLVPLLGPAEMVLDMSNTEAVQSRPWLPTVILYIVFVFVLLITFVFGVPVLGKISDWLFFSIFSFLSVLMIFCNFFSDHQAMHLNLLIIAFNPLLPLILGKILAGKECRKLSQVALSLAILYFLIALIAGQGIHPVSVPLILILMILLYKHSKFGKEENELIIKKK
jgi:hypothetical protein